MLSDEVAGDPMSRQKWVRSSIRNLSKKLKEQCHQAGHGTVARLLRKMDSGSKASFRRSARHFRGRDASYLAPPAQIRTGPIRAYGSHLGCLTAKRLSGHGWRIRGFGSQSSAHRLIRSQVVQSFWLRCRSVRRQRLVTWNRNAVRVELFVGTAW